MADCEQVSQDRTAIYGACRGFAVDTPITLPLTGDEGGETPLSEYSLHFEMSLVPRGDGRGASYRRWFRGFLRQAMAQTIVFGHLCGRLESKPGIFGVMLSSLTLNST